MKKAFTMLELVMVIVVIGILAAVIIPRTDSNSLREAAIQVISHIRYTQHLAMVDDKFDVNEAGWYNRRWMLRFQENLVYTTLAPNNAYNNEWAYTISSDLPNFTGHHPDLNGMAKNPLNPEQYMSGGYDNVLHVEDPRSMKKLRLGSSYNIKDVTFGGGCRSTTLFIHFDHLGRPMNSFNVSSAYEADPGGFPRLLTQACIITLSDGSDNVQIAIEPETGYAHILP
ncbi:type II secretion system protein [Sulfurimonas sp.]|uniref:pilus assembly FimT family protein n=1 Tax=Sulfurimonas sp. TaxID=2022749 RepID=UPI00262DD20C|nr:type II secretion system protein [Sulfurimonas sp.]MCW8896311.1 type II secretion system GspH family protein [Sulfurimonas sp.]